MSAVKFCDASGGGGWPLMMYACGRELFFFRGEDGVQDVAGSVFLFFQAEDGIRDVAVTGVQTCALPISVAICQPAPFWPVRQRCSMMPSSRSAQLESTPQWPRPSRASGSRRRRINSVTGRSEERRVGKSVDLGGRRIIKKKKKNRQQACK